MGCVHEEVPPGLVHVQTRVMTAGRELSVVSSWVAAQSADHLGDPVSAGSMDAPHSTSTSGRHSIVQASEVQSSSLPSLLQAPSKVEARRCDSFSIPSLRRAKKPVLGLQSSVQYRMG